MDQLSGGELAIASVAWIVLVALAALVLLLYQQLDRAYGLSGTARGARLSPGDELPPLEVVSPEDGLLAFHPAEEAERVALTFVTGSCSACLRLVRHLVTAHEEASWPADIATVLAVSNGSLPGPLVDALRSSPIRVVAVAEPAAVTRDWGVVEVPTTYAIAEGHLVGLEPTRSLEEVLALFAPAGVA